MVLMLLGISLFGAITATITSYLLSTGNRDGKDPSLADDLERLAALHSQGALTDAEFSLAKSKLLNATLRPQHQQVDPSSR
jgi:hypothetical protein